MPDELAILTKSMRFVAYFLQRRLLRAALLADIADAGFAFRRLEAVRRAAFAADRLDAGLALFDGDGRLAHQPFGFFTHRLLGHRVVSRDRAG